VEASASSSATHKLDDFLNFLGDDAKQISPATVEAQLRSNPPILEQDERVEMAFRCGRDSTLFTSKRIIYIDVKGWSGKKVEYLTVLWKSIRAFSIETAGGMFDRDAELVLWTNIKAMKCIEQDLRKGKADIIAIERYISNMVLGVETVDADGQAVSMAGHVDSGPSNLFEWAGDDARQIDADKADRQFHSSPPILQNCEHVEMAFKGRRDMMLFTTKRLIVVDMKGWSGKKVKYLSVPWATVQAFGVRSAGSMMDNDSEMMIWTDIMNNPEVGDDPATPGMSYFEQDFRKDKVDLMAIHRYLSAKCLGTEAEDATPPPAITPEVIQSGPPNGVESLLSWLGQDATQIDPEELDRQLHGDSRMLRVDEKVVMAFKVGRDTTCFTTKRALFIDVQGWTGSKVEYKSIPYKALRAFSVESAGSWDRDSEVKLYPKTYWMPVVVQDLRKGKADIIAIQNFLSQKLFGDNNIAGADQGVGVAVGAAGSVGVDGFLSWLGGDARAVDAAEVDRQLHSAPCILMADEKAESAFKVGRDMLVLTTKRVLRIDVQGWTGNKVEYKSVPLKHCSAFHVQSPGMLDFDAESGIYTDVPGWSCCGTDLRKGGVDIFAFEAAVAAKILQKST